MDTVRDIHDSHDDDPVARDIADRSPATADVVAGEQVLDEGRIAPDQDEVGHRAGTPVSDQSGGESSSERATAADERTDAGAPPRQEEPG